MLNRHFIFAALIVSMSALVFAPVADARRTDQETARQQLKSGQLKPYAQIERNVRSRMRGMKYLGSQFDERNSTYRFKFLQRNSETNKSRVIYVDVDAKSGAILNRR